MSGYAPALPGDSRLATAAVIVEQAHFLMKTSPRVASEMALRVLAYNLTRVIKIMGIQSLMAAIRV